MIELRTDAWRIYLFVRDFIVRVDEDSDSTSSGENI